MPVIRLQAGMNIDVPDRAEISDTVQASIQADREREAARGYKWMRLPENLSGAVASSAITLGSSKGQVCGPEQGYAWTLRRLVVTGLTTGATPDVVNLYRNDMFARSPLWQFNGNNFGYTFGRSEMVLMPGDTLSLQNVGTIAATGNITLSGELEEVPAEMLYKVR